MFRYDNIILKCWFKYKKKNIKKKYGINLKNNFLIYVYKFFLVQLTLQKFSWIIYVKII